MEDSSALLATRDKTFCPKLYVSISATQSETYACPLFLHFPFDDFPYFPSRSKRDGARRERENEAVIHRRDAAPIADRATNCKMITSGTDQGCQMAKFDPFLSFDCARVEGVGKGRDQILQHSVAEP